MANPVLVEVIRGGVVESRHCGAVAIVDASGHAVTAIGDIAEAVFPRSAVKAMQALLLVESGAADAYRFGARELALACASHGGEPAHVALAADMLRRAGLDEAALLCGAHAPAYEPARRALLLAGEEPTCLHNNCSGKHAGFLCAARHLGWDVAGYVEPEHPVQVVVRGILEDLTGTEFGPGERATDGCSIPTYAVPLERLAFGFARMASGAGISQKRAEAARRLIAACQAEPYFVAGTGRFCTQAMTVFGRRLLVKTGAEGVFCAAFPELGLGVALKCDDGATRASEMMMAAVVDALLRPEPAEKQAFAERLLVPVLTVRGKRAGEIRPSADLLAALALQPP